MLLYMEQIYKIWWSMAARFSSYASGQTDRRTNRRTHYTWQSYRSDVTTASILTKFG